MNKSLYILNQDLNVVGIMKNKGKSLSFYDDLHTESLETGAELYEFTSPADHELSEHLKIGNLIVFKNLDGNDVMFTILKVEDIHGQKFEKRVYTENAGMQLLNEIEDPYSATTQNYLPYYANRAIQFTGWTLGENESESNLTLKFEEYDTVLKRLQRIASEFDMELYFTVEMKGSSIVAKKVNFVKQRGSNHGKRFSYSKDITQIIRTVDGTEIITAVKGVGKTDDKGVTTTFKSKIYDDGDFYTQNGSDVIYSRTALEEWGKQGANIWGVLQYDTSNSETLFTRSLNHLKKNKNPKVTYQVDVVLLERLSEYDEEKVRIGDTVRITDFEFNPPLLLEARVAQLETSYTDPSKDFATLANFKLVKSNIAEELRMIQSKLLRNEATWEQIGETIIKQAVAPSDPTEGQLWLNTDNNIIYVFDGTNWVATSLDPSLLEDIQEQIEVIEVTLNGKESLVLKTPTAPSSPTEGQLWLDTSSTPNQLKVYLSGSWESATPDNVYIEDLMDDKVENIQIGSRNYVLDSDRFNIGYFQQFEVVNGFEDFRGKQITISVDVIVENANLNQTLNRLGYEPAVEFADGTTEYFGVWYYPTQGETGKYRISKTFDFPDKDIVGFPQDGTFIQITGDYVAVGRPQIEIGNKASDWKPANEDFINSLDDAVTGINGDITDLNTALTDFETEVNGSFRDGLVNESEKLVIKSYLEQINNEKTSIDSQYNTVYANVSLNTTTEKTNLASAKTAYNTAHTNLVTAINNAIADSTITQAERDDISAKFTAYRTSLTTFEQRLQQALDKISSKKVDDAKTELNGYIDAVEQDVIDINQALTDFETEVNSTFKDGIISQAEAKVIKGHLQQINTEKTGLDIQYSTIYANTSLNSTTEKTNLLSAKTAYDTAHTNLVNAINTAITDGKATTAEITDVESKFTAYRTALSTLNQRLQQAIDKIGSKKVDDAKTELNLLIDGVEQEVTDLNQALTDFETEVNGTFKDGVISQAEAIVIKSHLQTINNEKSEFDIQYTTVYANTALNSTTEKTNLASAKTAYDTAHTNLVNSINTATADSVITTAEKTDVDAKFVAYRTALSTLNQRLQQALDKIGSVRDGLIQIGGENLISNSAPDNLTGWNSVPTATGTIDVIDEATAPLGRALIATFDATMTGVKISPVVTMTNSRSYTWSVWLKASKAVTLTVGNEKGGTKTVSVTTSWARHEMTFTSSTGTAYAMVFNDHTNAMNAGDILYIHSLKLEEGTRATSWSASSREVKSDVQFIRQDINDIQQNTSESAITTTIFNSTRYTEDLAKKANTDDIADMATQEELSDTAKELQENIDKKADSTLVTQAFEQISQVEQTAQDFQFKLQASGGINLLKNSVGYADFKAWTKTGTVQTFVNEDFTKFGSDAVFNFVNGTITQTALVETGNLYTLNFVVDKPSTGELTVAILDGGVSVASQVFANGTAYDHVRHSMTVSVLSNTVTVQITGTSGQIGVLMLNIGSEPLQWQQAHDEIYTSNVQFDQSGITVKSTAYNGYTVISPDEFAGYAEVIDDNGNASVKRIFTLNGDTTEVNKLKAEKEISMGQIKILDVNSTRKGWAFIKNN